MSTTSILIIVGMLLLGVAAFVTHLFWMATQNKRISKGKCYITSLVPGKRAEGLFPVKGEWVDLGDGEILMTSDTVFYMQYPPTAKRWPPGFCRTTVPSMVVRQGNPEGIVAVSIDKIPISKIDDAMVKRIKRDATANAVGLLRKTAAEIGGGVVKLGFKPIYLYVLLGLVLVVGLTGAVLGFLNMSSLKDIAGWFGG